MILTGHYPKKPPRKAGNKNMVVITVSNIHTSVTSVSELHWRECPSKFYEKVIRSCKQIEQEMIAGSELSYRVFPSAKSFRQFAGRCRRRRMRNRSKSGYKGHQLNDGTIAVIFHTHPKEQGDPVPTDKGMLFDLISSWVNNLPIKTRDLVSNGWGGKYQGSRGDGRTKQARKAGKRVKASQFWKTNHEGKKVW